MKGQTHKTQRLLPYTIILSLSFSFYLSFFYLYSGKCIETICLCLFHSLFCVVHCNCQILTGDCSLLSSLFLPISVAKSRKRPNPTIFSFSNIKYVCSKRISSRFSRDGSICSNASLNVLNFNRIVKESKYPERARKNTRENILTRSLSNFYLEGYQIYISSNNCIKLN